MMKQTVLSVLFLFLALAASAAPLKWFCNWPEAKSQTFSLYHGESATFEPVFVVNGKAATNLTIEAVYYQTSGMADAWWQLPGATFAPSNDCGAASYRFFVRAVGADGVNYRANGMLRMIDSPGFTPGEVALPIRRLDFSTVEVVNPPYYTKSETDAKIVELAPTPDLSGYATTQSLMAEVSSASQSATNYTETIAEALYEASKEYTDSAIGEASSLRPQWVDYARLTGNAPDYPSEWRHDLSPWPAMYVGDDEDMTSFATLFHLWCVNTNLIARITATSSVPGDYATISNLAVHAVQPSDLSSLETDPTIKSWAKAATKPTYSLNEVCPSAENWLGVPGTTSAGKSIKVLAKTVNGVIEGGMTVTGSSNNDNNTTKYRYAGVTVTRNGTATDYLFDGSSQSGIVRRSELASKANAADVATISAMLNAENARFVSTNYNSNAHIPEAYVEAKIDGSWLAIWSEMTRWNWFFNTYLPANLYTKAQLDAALEGKADRAWGFYDSHSGLYAPNGYTWVSSPKIAIAGGLAYQRTVTSEGAIWVLEANGMVAETGGLTNGFFRVSDDEGKALFEIVKGDKRTVGAQASSVQVVGAFSPTKLQIGYAVIADTHPTLQITASLNNPDWYSESDASCPANVTWSGTSGNYVAVVQAKSASATQLFVKAEYQIGGETYIKNSGPVAVDGGILCTDGIHKVRPVYNNGSVTWEVMQ